MKQFLFISLILLSQSAAALLNSTLQVENEKVGHILSSFMVHYANPGNNAYGSNEGISFSSAFYKGKWGPIIGIDLFFFEDLALNDEAIYQHIPDFNNRSISSFTAYDKDLGIDLNIGISRLDKNIGNSRVSVMSFVSTGIRMAQLASKDLELQSASEIEYKIVFGKVDKILIPIKIGTSIMIPINNQFNFSLGAVYGFSFTNLEWEYSTYNPMTFDLMYEEAKTKSMLNNISLTAGVHLLYPNNK